MLLILGALVVLGAVGGGYVMEGGHFAVLNQPAEFIIIFGAAGGSLLIGTSAADVKRLVKQCAGLLKGSGGPAPYVELLSMLFQVFKLSQQGGIMALESHFETPATSSVLMKFPGFLARHGAV